MKIYLTCILLFLSGVLIAQDVKEIDQIFDSIQKIDQKYRRRGGVSEFSYNKVEDLISKSAEYEDQVEKLIALREEDLSRQDQISRDIMMMILNDDISYVKYRQYLMDFNAEGGFYNRGSWVIRSRRFNKEEDFQNYTKWLSSYAKYIDYNVGLLKQGIKENIVRPKVIVKNTLQLMEPWMVSDLTKNPFSQPFYSIPEDFKELDKMKKDGLETIEKVLLPAYVRLQNFFETDYMKAASEEVGISGITNGREYYEDRVRFYTTMEMSPDSVFNLGMQEVSRIRTQMEQVIENLKFEGSFEDFFEFLRKDPQFYVDTPQELLNHAAWLSKKAEGELPKLFGNLYSLPFTVKPVAPEIAPTYTAGRYSSGSRENDQAGTYLVNTYDLPSRPLYNLPALTLHEAVPGHHLDYGVRSELEGIPNFRKRYYFSAFGEGWGLYSEFLGEEMGMYTTPYELFGRYTYEMWRACRLVVDVGMHYKGWTRQEAIDFLASNSALSIHEVNTEIDRYIGWPGQAVSYKIGEITIKSLREGAEAALGEKFDIKEFHQNILKNGSVPLPILRQEIESYIEEEGSKRK